jgi:hypothetical protein
MAQTESLSAAGGVLTPRQSVTSVGWKTDRSS